MSNKPAPCCHRPLPFLRFQPDGHQICSLPSPCPTEVCPRTRDDTALFHAHALPPHGKVHQPLLPFPIAAQAPSLLPKLPDDRGQSIPITTPLPALPGTIPTPCPPGRTYRQRKQPGKQSAAGMAPGYGVSDMRHASGAALDRAPRLEQLADGRPAPTAVPPCQTLLPEAGIPLKKRCARH